jgi:signal transduction histidine kinase
VRAVALGGLGAGLLATWVVLAPTVRLPTGDPGWYIAAAAASSLAVAVLLVARLPGSAVTRIVTIMTLCVLSGLAHEAVTLANGSYRHVDDSWWSGLVFLGTLPLLPVLLVVFPDGVPSRGWWRGVFVAQLVALGLLAPLSLVVGRTKPAPAAFAAAAILLGAVLIVSGMVRAIGLVILWRRADPVRHRQLTAFVAVAAAIAALYAVAAARLLAGSSDASGGVLANLSLAFILGGLPTALGLSVLRHHLYGIAVVVNRVAVAAFASLLLFGTYAVAAVAVATVVGGPRELRWESVLPAAFAVAALGPAFRLAGTVVDRVMFGDRDRPDRALRSLARRLGQTVDPTEVPQTVVDTAADTLRLPFVALDRQGPDGLVRAASRGTASQPERVVALPISYGGERIAELLVAPRSGETVLGTADRALMTDLAGQAGPALYAGRLVLDLADSRERLRQGQLEERARLRRALHDGLSPTLSGISLAAAAAGDLPAGDPNVARLLSRIQEEAADGALTLRAHLADLRPPGLAELGLIPAIEQRARQLAEPGALHIEVTTREPLPALEPDVEQATYLIVVELLTNVTRHAAATSCTVEFAANGPDLLVRISDNGRGLPADHRPGDGLRSAVERAESFGGRLLLGNGHHGGTQAVVYAPGWRP